jgi:predicted component of type VI protein secretion system
VPRLFLLSGPDLGQTVDITDTTVLGRALDSGVVLRSNTVSRSHAKLTPVNGGWTLEDMGSSNGTRLEGMAVTEAALLEDGAMFQVGDIELRFRVEVPVATAVVREPEPVEEPTEEPNDDFGEIELEGDWDQDAEASLPLRAGPSTDGESVDAVRPAAAHTIGAPMTPAQPAPRAAAVVRKERPKDMPRGRSEAANLGKPILQYNRVESRSGFFSADLGQQPLLVRLAVYLGVALTFAGVLWGVFQLVQRLKGTQAA